MSDDMYLPDRPNEWGELKESDGQRWYQRWTEGAFGDRTDLVGVIRFRVLEEEWEFDAEGIGWRTIKRAEIFDTGLRAS